MSGKWFRRLFGASKVHCDDLPLEDQMEDHLTIEEEEHLEESTKYLPSYPFLLHPVRELTSSSPYSSDVEGFRFSAGMPLSPNFLLQHTFNLTSKKSPATGNQMFDMFAEKTPFYSMMMQYAHGNLSDRRAHPAFALVGSIDSNGRISAIFAKSLRNFKLRLQSMFPNSNMAMAQTSLEIEHSAPNTKQTVTLSSHVINYNLVERLGRSCLLGFDLTYSVMQNAWINGLALRYSPRPNQRYYVQYTGMPSSLTLGALHKLDESNTMVTELEFGGMATSKAALGYRFKGKSFQVDSVVRTNGEIKSSLSLSKSQFFQLKLFLSGNLTKEENKSGYSFSIGQFDE